MPVSLARPRLVAPLALAALAGCDDDPGITTARDTLSDPYGGLTAMGEVLYATNHDASGHAGRYFIAVVGP